MIVNIFLFCSPMPVENENAYSIRLNLEYAGNVTAEFTGEPILAIIETADSVLFSSLTWKTGNGLYSADDTTYLKSRRRFNAYLSWNTYPRHKDTADNGYYDTIYIGLGGNIKRSNPVIVKVSNLPVVIDSMKAGTRTFKPSETIWKMSVHDSIHKLNIRIYARDFDNKTPDMVISGSNYVLEKYQGEPFRVGYVTPAGQFKDTLIFTLFDRAQGQDVKELFLERVYPNTPPVIDSVRIYTGIFRFAGGKPRAAFEEIDTLRLRLYYHDNNDTVSSITWSLKKNALVKDDGSKASISLVCTTSNCKKIATRNLITIDTVRVVLHDSKGDSAVGYIYIGKRILNKPPVIMKVVADSSTVNDTNTAVTFLNGRGYEKKILTLEVYDPDSTRLSCIWNVKKGKLNIDSGTTVVYSAPSFITRDTITVTLSDNELTAKSLIIVNVHDIFPVIDSMRINSKNYKNLLDTAWYEAFYDEQIIVTTWIRDLDNADTMKYSWKIKDSSRVTTKVDNRLVLRTHFTRSIDTLSLSIVDGAVSKEFKVLLNVNSPEPVIDSILIDSTAFKNSEKDIVYTAAYPDTLTVSVFARDFQGDPITIGCESLLKNRVSKISATMNNYVTVDSSYTDTVTISVHDTKNYTIRKIYLNVKGSGN
jgi:hypothetical protein